MLQCGLKGYSAICYNAAILVLSGSFILSKCSYSFEFLFVHSIYTEYLFREEVQGSINTLYCKKKKKNGQMGSLSLLLSPD